MQKTFAYLLTRVPFIALVLLSAISPLRAAEPALTPEGIEFFEKKIRPLLVEKCYSCHSAKAEKIKGALLLDSRVATLKGGATGPAVVPGDVSKSLIVKAVRYKEEKLQMPPDEELNEHQVADIEAWVKMGAPDPRNEITSISPDPNKAREFWSFKKPVEHVIPTLKKDDPALTPLDKIVRAKLEAKNIQPSAPADKRTLIRRATFDLTGLPPTAEEIDAFVADNAPDAFAKVIDRLLASPRYGERWGRYWLDVARYADTKGYVFEEERRYPFSYVYRDWVIKAINDDMPYDQFLINQVAADKLPPSEDNRNLAAMGFLLLGRRFLNNQADIIDDRLDVLMRGTQGLTIGCARCHDHKFDAITQKDYYSLYAIFAASTEPKELPLVGKPDDSPTVAQFNKELKEKEDELEAVKHKLHETKLKDLRSAKSIADYFMAVHDAAENGEKTGQIVSKRDLNRFMFDRWKAYLKSNAKPDNDVFGAWNALAGLKETEFAAQAPELCKKIAANDGNKLNPLIVKAFGEKPPATLREAADRYGALISKSAADAESKDAATEKLRLVLYAPGAPANVEFKDISNLYHRDDMNKERDARKKIDALYATHAGAPMRAMVLNDLPSPGKQHVFLRGNPGNPGEEVQRRYVSLLGPKKEETFKNGSGRLELAQSIVNPENPLTARVMANRVWAHHFGKPLVGTPSDFGVRSDAPTNQDLLDHLAISFMKNGWSTKKLHREIMLSRTYQQDSADNSAARAIDPENALLWRFNRQRLDFEALRDSLLFAGGQLDAKMYGRAVDLFAQPFTKRRSIYGYIDRQNLPGVFRAFDFASPDAHSPQRFVTTVPQQALFMMNSPFVLDQARALAARPELKDEHDTAAKIQKLYRAIFGRAASADEVALASKFIEQSQAETSGSASMDASPWKYGYGLFDEKQNRVSQFTPFAHFAGNAWQGAPKLPDVKLQFANLSADGGHPGNKPSTSVIRRWVAPRDGTFSVSGKINHPGKNGDGVRGRIVSSAEGDLGHWSVLTASSETKVEKLKLKKGETLDFVTECQKDDNTDSFQWQVTIRILDYGASFSDEHGAIEWSSKTGFSGPPGKPVTPLAPWEKLAQVLLLANEFVFVD